jgi:hypothetical protein
MGKPFVAAAHCCGGAALFDDLKFQIVDVPSCNFGRNHVSVGNVDSQHTEHGCTVVRVVRMEADPTIGRSVVSGNRIPYRWERPPLRSEEALAPECGRRLASGHGDTADVRSIAHGQKLGGGERGYADSCGRQAGHVEHGWKHASITRQLQPVQRRSVTPEQRPELSVDVVFPTT